MTDAPPGGPVGGRAESVMRLAGALVSLTLVVGIGIWGYRLVVRETAGIPVVRAMQGPMREAPQDPGGQIALNTGLAVNAVAALGEAAPPEDVLMLAPATPALAPEDLEVQSMAEAGEVMADDLSSRTAPASAAAEAAVTAAAAAPEAAPEAAPVLLAASDRPMTAAEVLALADMIAAGVDPLTPLAAPAPDAPASADAATAAAPVSPAFTGTAADAVVAALAAAPITPIPSDVPGVSVALRPPARPGSAATAATTTAAADAAPPGPAAEGLLSGPLPAGTALVQLGAYETAEVALADWLVLSDRFADFMGGKTRVIQAAESGGEAFVRLRAAGFADIEDANRFCAVLIAEGARCVPVLEE